MTTNHRIITSTLAAAAALALGAGAGPASARPYDLNGNGPYVPAGQVAAGQPSSDGSSPRRGQGAPPILPAPNPSQRAAIQRAEQQAAHRPALPKGARYSNAEMNAYPSRSAAARAIDGGFGWGDAGVGAAGGFAIAILAVGGGLALSQRRSRRPDTSALVTG